MIFQIILNLCYHDLIQHAALFPLLTKPFYMLTLITTPIGNLNDMSPRAISAIEQADILACEDTRITTKLISLLGIQTKAKLIPYHDHNGARMRPQILEALEKNLHVGLISDAGTPLISDPGYKLVREVQEKHLPITATAGACAPVLALILSGLPTDRFIFHGFLPDKQKAATSLLEECRHLSMTSVFFISPSQLVPHMTLIASIWGNRQAALVREITKLHEEVMADPLETLIARLQNAPRPKGEFVLVIGPPEKQIEFSTDDIEELLRRRLETLSVKDAVAEVASLTSSPRKTVYQMALTLSKDQK